MTTSGSGLLLNLSLNLNLLFILCYRAPRSAERHILTWALSRDRLPADAVLLIYAAVGIARLWERRAASTRARAM